MTFTEPRHPVCPGLRCLAQIVSRIQASERTVTLEWSRLKMAKKEGVDTVHTLGFGFGCTTIGLGRIGEVFERVADSLGERLVRVPPRAQCFPRSGPFWGL
jgi:hypothetical protein